MIRLETASLALLLILAPMASQAAVGVYEVITDQTTSSSVDYTGLEVACPPGKQALGGGARIIGSAAGPGLWHSRPVIVLGEEEATAWRAGATEITPTSSNWALEIQVVCGVVGHYEVVQETTSSLDDLTGSKSLVARCPDGKDLLGGGVRVLGAAGAPTITASGPDGPTSAPTGWLGEVTANDQPPGTTWGLTTYAICGVVSGYAVDSQSLPVSGIDPKSLSTSAPGPIVLSGGARGTGSAVGIGLTETLIVPPGDWAASATEFSPTADGWGLRVDAITAHEGVPSVPPQAPPARRPVEFSTLPDRQALPAGGTGPLDPGQVLATETPASAGLPRDALDVAPGIGDGDEPDAQIDALANGNDALFAELLANDTELILSVVGDAGAEEIATFQVSTGGGFAIEDRHRDLDPKDGSGEGGFDDLDGLELWGPNVADGYDALYYSFSNDALDGVSVYAQQNGFEFEWVPHSFVVTAVQSLGYAGDPEDVDIDALLVRNASGGDFVEAEDAQIVFSIRAVPGSGFDGSELILLDGDGSASFLEHGGRVWDTSFALSSELDDLIDGAGTAGEDIDAIEVPEPGMTPALCAGAMLVGALGWARRR